MNKKNESFWNLLISGDEIVVPIIQRDYAQGRDDERASTIRQKLLNSIGIRLTNDLVSPLCLDFIYGSGNGKRTELVDGQQRFTTLFLLHWYLAIKANALESNFDVLKNFTYRARTFSESFCKELCINACEIRENINKPFTSLLINEKWLTGLIDEVNTSVAHEQVCDILKQLDESIGLYGKPADNKFNQVLNTENNICEKVLDALRKNRKKILYIFEHPFTSVIRNAIWFLKDWENDPTVTSMLNMLDAIALHKDINNDCGKAWGKLTGTNSPIVFNFLSVDEFGNSEDLYIKMNSRGKQLTSFENFKALFGKHLEDIGENDLRKKYWSKIDGLWSEYFWSFIQRRYAQKGISDNGEFFYSIDDTILKYIWLQVEMYSVCINSKTDKNPPDFYLDNKAKLVFEHIYNSKSHKENYDNQESERKDWTGVSINNKSLEELLIQSLDRSNDILKLLDELLNDQTGIKRWDNASGIDELFVLEKWDKENEKVVRVKVDGKEDFLVRILAFVIIYWCSVFGVPKQETEKERLKEYLIIIRNILKRYRTKKATRRYFDSELGKENYGEVIRIIIDDILNPNDNCIDHISHLDVNSYNKYFRDEITQCQKISTYSSNERERCFELENSEILIGSINFFLGENEPLVTLQQLNTLFDCNNIIPLAKALLSYGSNDQYFAIPSGEANNNRDRITFYDSSIGAWTLAFLYDKKGEGFAERNTNVFLSLLKALDNGNSLSDITESYISKCIGSNNYSWQYYFISYWDDIFDATEINIAGRSLLKFPTFELYAMDDWFSCRTSSVTSRFSDENTCNVFLIMAATEWCKKHNCAVSTSFIGGKECKLQTESQAIYLSYNKEAKEFRLHCGSGCSSVCPSQNIDIVQELVSKIDELNN